MKYYPVHSGYPPYARVNRVIESAFAEHGRGNVQMPSKVYVTFGKTGDFRTMPAYLPAAGIAGVKIVNVHPNNRAHGLPTVMALTVIIDVDTGLPTALINATDLTALRTGAAGAVAARHLSPRRSSISLGLIGAGRQAAAQVEAMAAAFTLDEGGSGAGTRRLQRRLRRGMPITTPARSQSNAPATLTSSPRQRPPENLWLWPGGSTKGRTSTLSVQMPPGTRNLTPRILLRAEVFVDDREQAIHSGEVNVPVSTGLYDPAMIAGTLGEVVIGKKGRSSPDAITVFDSTGLAIQDLAIASLVLEDGEGCELPFP